MRVIHSDLFAFDNEQLAGDIFIKDGTSRLIYNEYAVFKSQDKDGNPQGDEHPTHISQCVMSDDEAEAERMFGAALYGQHSLDIEGGFNPHASPDPALEGRVRQIICRRRGRPDDGRGEGLSLSHEDFGAMHLHPATLHHVRRTTTEAMFWDQGHQKLSIILAFSGHPRPPYDFLSMTYNVSERCVNTLIRESFDPHRHSVGDLDEYERRMKACESHWAHPFILPVILLQVQLNLAEKHVTMNGVELVTLEKDVGNMAGFMAFDEKKRQSGRSSTASDAAGPMNTTQLMKNAHECLRKSIELLDTIRWMERALETLVKAGDELERKMAGPGGPPPSPVSPMPVWAQVPRLTVEGSDVHHYQGYLDPLSSHWHEIKQYLDSLGRVCKSVGTERSMLEQRCRAQIDVIYAKMAQEDNILNARMAVASTRDSSSMKALAVITAIFLPGEFIGTLFGISMFDWDGSGGDDDNDAPKAVPAAGPLAAKPHPVVSNHFWLYWAIVIPLTVCIITAWRVWWVGQDRFFRKHLSRELSEERYWTDNGRPRELERSFLHDFFYLSVRRDEKAADDRGNGNGNGNGNGRTGSFFSRTLSFSKDDSSGGVGGGGGELQKTGTVGSMLPRRRTGLTGGGGGGAPAEKASGARNQRISFARQNSRRVTGSAMV